MRTKMEFAATGRADDADEFASMNFERDVVERNVPTAFRAESFWRSRMLKMTGRSRMRWKRWETAGDCSPVIREDLVH